METFLSISSSCFADDDENRQIEKDGCALRVHLEERGRTHLLAHLLLPECLLDALLLHLDQVDPIEVVPDPRATAEAARQPGVLVRLALAAGARNGAGAAALNLPQGGKGLLHGGGPRDRQADVSQKS